MKTKYAVQIEVDGYLESTFVYEDRHKAEDSWAYMSANYGESVHLVQITVLQTKEDDAMKPGVYD